MSEGHPISGQTKRRAMWVSTKKGGVRKATPSVTRGTPRVRAAKDDDVVRFRTFPSETARRLMATMALAMDHPRALLTKKGGSVGLLDIPPDGEFSDGASDTGSSAGAVEDQAECRGNTLWRDVSGEEFSKGVTDCVVLPISSASVADSGPMEGRGDSTAKRKRKPKQRGFDPSKGQMARTFSKCLPKQDVEEFKRLFKSFQGVGVCPSGCDSRGISINALIIKTRVVSILWSLQQMYGVKNVVCEMCDHMNDDRRAPGAFSKRDYLEIIAMDAVLSRTLKAPRRVTGTETVDTPVKFRVNKGEHLEPNFDFRFRAFVVVVPDGATYYCHRERRNDSIGVANEVIPMDTSWLRVVKNGGCDTRFAGGGYVSRLWDGQPFWKFKISRGESNFQLKPIPENPLMRLTWNSTLPTLKVMLAHQCPDEQGPCLPPDVIGGERHDGVREKSHLRRVYRSALRHSMASRRGCRHYAATYLHGVIDPNETLIIDPKEGDTDVRVSMQIMRGGARGHRAEDDKKTHVGLARESVVHVRYLPNLGSGALKLLSDIRDHASLVTKGKGQSARAGCGDRGSMHPVGMRIMKDKKTRRRYKTSGNAREQEPLRRAVVASARLAAVTIPGVLRIIQDAEADGDIGAPDPGIEGDGEFSRISYSMDISVDLQNASHYDVNDASQGFSIWTEEEPGSTRNWYFVLPNVYGKWPPGSSPKNGAVFHGLAIKLTHGTLVSWDGRVIRHCTSMMQRTKHVYGSFFAAKSSVVAYGARMAFMRDLMRRRRSGRRQGRAGTGGDNSGHADARKGGVALVCNTTDVMVASSSSTTRPAGDSPANACGERGAASADLLSLPIARRKKVSDSDPLCVRIGTANVELCGAKFVCDAVSAGGKWEGGASPVINVDVENDVMNRADEITSDDESWTGHSYASGGGDSGSADSGMVVDSTDNNGNGLMKEVIIEDDDDDIPPSRVF